jgi:tripartite-type tricarboxylate transporter receptor subunit TctC
MIRLPRRTILAGGFVTLAAPVIFPATRTLAQDAYPNRPIRMIVPWPPGGVTDVVARLIALKLSSELGQSVVVENRPGASGTIGHAAAAQAEPDGYTVLFGSNSTYAMAPYLLAKVPYDNEKSFAPVSLVARSPHVLCAHPSVPVQDFAGFLQYVRARQPDGVAFSSAGPGSSGHLATELLMSMANFRMLHVPYRGGGPALQALLAGQVQVSFVNLVVAMPLAGDKRMTMLGVSATERMPTVPDLPTISELGVAGFETSTDLAVFLPAGTPKTIIQRIHTGLVTAIKSKEVTEALRKEGAIIVAGSPEDFPVYFAKENAKWRDIIVSRGIKEQQ